ncbi:FAD-binding protein [Demequina mangrovi]|uniref:3-oxosteroid 1-dehydrogenase n=1 Tax=Demequina mangrovi TaxID=1043493 RepID=A0A1H6VDI6_9MICO|nr:FAD-binding protein [Demequina mangrovi]SEI98245.1 3-oxosteroid 1-dehydrogenase [Demequina mangrovi]
MAEWDEEVDLLVVGTGAGAMSAAIAAADEGLAVLVVEASDKWGGSTAMSGGGCWLPTHPGMKEIGVEDSEDKVLTYMDACVGAPEEVGPASSLERRHAFVRTAPVVHSWLEDHGLVWKTAKKYPEYYPDLPGGIAGGRTVEPAPFDVKKLGAWYGHARETLPPGLPLFAGDTYLLARSWSTFSGMIGGANLVFRALGGAVTGKKLTGLGMSLAARLMYIAKEEQGTEVRLESPLVDLVVEKGVVVGAVIGGPEGDRRIRTRVGVHLGAGGFDHNAEWRKTYQGLDDEQSSGNPANLGGAIEIAMRHGADVALMDDAWWGPSVAPTSKGGPTFIVSERSMPFSMVVDQEGSRYVNESTSYVDFGHAMIERGLERTNHSWMILDVRHRRRYLNNAFLMGSKTFYEEGVAVKADTLEELAEKMGVDKATFKATVQRFNSFARKGVDEDFGRGHDAYDTYYGDPTHGPNPNLGEIARGPFVALKIVLGDLGTKGGLLTDEDARVINAKGKVIEGLYAAGNTSASVCGRTYPGAGSTLGPALVFGYLAGRHAATRAAEIGLGDATDRAVGAPAEESAKA